MGVMVTLGLQVCLGVANNLWLHQVTPNLEHATPPWLLSAHTTVGEILLVVGIWFVVEARRSRSSQYLGPAISGLVGLVLAFASGEAYWATESNIYSILMTVGFAFAVVSYGLAGRQT